MRIPAMVQKATMATAARRPSAGIAMRSAPVYHREAKDGGATTESPTPP